MKLNENEVCTSGGGNQPGTFNSVKKIQLTHFKLVHRSGGLCSKKWGCSGNKQTMFITNSNNRLHSPGYDSQEVELYGQDVETDELIVRAGHPIFIKNEDTLKVWYKWDFRGTSERPGEEVCFDVYGYGKLFQVEVILTLYER